MAKRRTRRATATETWVTYVGREDATSLWIGDTRAHVTNGGALLAPADVAAGLLVQEGEWRESTDAEIKASGAAADQAAAALADAELADRAATEAYWRATYPDHVDQADTAEPPSEGDDGP